MRKKILFVASIFCLFSCNTNYRYIYTASPANNPYFTKKGESKLTADYSSSNNIRPVNKYAAGIDLQAAYALGDHWALATAYYNRREKDVFSSTKKGPFESSAVRYKRNLFDIGGGYFISLNKKKTITFNFYGGMSFGKFSFIDDGKDSSGAGYSRFHNNGITRWFFQPSFNFMPSEYIRFSYATKFSFVHYGNLHTSYTAEELKYLFLDKVDNQTLPFIEPSLNVQFALPEIPWINLDAGISSTTNPLNVFIFNGGVKVRSINSSIGLNFDFSKLKKK
jgi:hypothetical protein